MMQEFAQEVEDTARAVVEEIHTALPGIIVSFDCDSGTATVQPSGKYITSDGKSLEYPQISEVPVMFPFNNVANAGIVFPVLKGDSCLIVISEVELDEWRTGAESEGSLRFDLTNAICIPGLMKAVNNVISKACNNNAVIISSNNTQIMLSSNGISMCGDLFVSGNIITTGTVKAGKTDFLEHTHKSAEPGYSTGKPE